MRPRISFGRMAKRCNYALSRVVAVGAGRLDGRAQFSLLTMQRIVYASCKIFLNLTSFYKQQARPFKILKYLKNFFGNFKDQTKFFDQMFRILL